MMGMSRDFAFVAYRDKPRRPASERLRPVKATSGDVVVAIKAPAETGRIYRWELAELDPDSEPRLTGWFVEHCGHPTALRPYWIGDARGQRLKRDGLMTWVHVRKARAALVEAYLDALIPRTE